MLVTLKKYRKRKLERLPVVARVIEAKVASITGKIETLGSNFRHETRKNASLLPSIATTIKVFPGFFFYYAPLTCF